ncbi:MAG: O-antigen ligase family protein [Chloroflexi bacterium]|nr:O-antigen ligase family protein [Chloroflexota bacterium]
MAKDRWTRMAHVFWVLTLLTLPVTSFRFYPSAFGAMVRPLAFGPLIIFVLLQAAAVLLGRRAWPRWGWALWVPWAAWLAWALVSTGYALSQPGPPPYLGTTYPQRALRAWISLAVGQLFFLGGLWAHQARDEATLRRSFRWLYVGFLLVAAWATLQTIAIAFNHFELARWIDNTQAWVVLRGWGDRRRVQGLAFEPSWFADQLTRLYLPWLIALWWSGYRFGPRWLAPLNVAGVFVLLFWTYSRTGLLTALAVLGLIGLLVLVRGWMAGHQPTARRLGRGLWGLMLGMAFLALVAGLANQRYDYLRVLLDVPQGKPLIYYFVNIRAGPRLAYAWAGANIYLQHPWMGVGLGGAPFYMEEALPEWSRTILWEVARVTSPLHRTLLNPKNLYVRVLAETGIVGGVWVLVFLIVWLAASLRMFWRARDAFERFIGLAALWVGLSTLIVWASIDSLALPNFWLNAGMLAPYLTTALAREPAPPSSPPVA